MNLKVFEGICAVVAHGSFRHAAFACGISQPALSMQIKNLEEELGVQLFERQHRGVILTAAGREIYQRAELILKEVKDIRALAELWHDPYQGQLVLGAIPTLGPYLFPRIRDHLVDSYPELECLLVEEKTERLLTRLRAGTIDAAFLALPVDEPELHVECLFSEPFLLAVPSEHEWRRRKTVARQELLGQPLLLLDDGHCLRDQALSFCQTAGIGERVDFRASSLATLLQMIAMGNAMSLVPKIAVMPSERIHYLSIKSPSPERKIGLCWRHSSVRAVLFDELVDDIRRESASW